MSIGWILRLSDLSQKHSRVSSGEQRKLSIRFGIMHTLIHSYVLMSFALLLPCPLVPRSPTNTREFSKCPPRAVSIGTELLKQTGLSAEIVDAFMKVGQSVSVTYHQSFFLALSALLSSLCQIHNQRNPLPTLLRASYLFKHIYTHLVRPIHTINTDIQ
jgi:hypothetical protein